MSLFDFSFAMRESAQSPSVDTDTISDCIKDFLNCKLDSPPLDFSSLHKSASQPSFDLASFSSDFFVPRSVTPMSQKSKTTKMKMTKRDFFKRGKLYKKKVQTRQINLSLDSEWMLRGKMLDCPISFRKCEITEDFLATDLGKKALFAAEVSLKEKSSPMAAKDKLLNMTFTGGTCKGQSYAIMVAFMKQQKDTDTTLFEVIQQKQVIFFQAVEKLRNVQRHEALALDASVKLSITCNRTVEKISLDTLEELSGLQRVVQGLFDLFEENCKEKVEKLIDAPELRAIQLSLYKEKPGSAHSIVALVGRNILLYDSRREAGLYKYSEKEDLTADLFTYFSKLKTEENPLRYILVNGFAQAKIDERKA
jgi:hypothetical protein